METNKNEISDDEAGRDYTSHDLFRLYELVVSDFSSYMCIKFLLFLKIIIW